VASHILLQRLYSRHTEAEVDHYNKQNQNTQTKLEDQNRVLLKKNYLSGGGAARFQEVPVSGLVT
jgi:hypothetical protein